MIADRFAYEANLSKATRHRGWRNALWPPAGDYRLIGLDIAARRPVLGPAALEDIALLRSLIETEWTLDKVSDPPADRRLRQADAVADCLERIAAHLPTAADRRAAVLRAGALRRGYDDDDLAELAATDEEIAFVAGRLSTWYGKQTGGLPTAFGCVRDAPGRAAVAAARACLDELPAYLHGLRAGLRLGDVPAFAATEVFSMAGEGDRHPKHIAYFLPEDEGVKRSVFKKSYYFANSHRALVGGVSLPHARRFLDPGRPAPDGPEALGQIPTLGVWAHEAGHFVHREGYDFAALNAADRWASITLQEIAADVFGTLFLVEVLAPALDLDPADCVLYHLAECLRYTDRGFGLFPDCDGMFLQLQYLADFGALAPVSESPFRLAYDPEVVLAGFRSLGRVLADTLLAGEVRRSVALYRDYGPAAPHRLAPLVDALRAGPIASVEYFQELPVTRADRPVAVAS